MKKIVLMLAMSLAIVFSGISQSKNLKGPQYKNAKPSVKYKGNTTILVRENPNQFKGPELKNLNSRNYEKVVIEPEQIVVPTSDLIVSSQNKIYEKEEEKEKIIYRRVRTKDMKGKNSKGLKGPAYKNHRP
ncbi:MAG: hypothetical protein JXR07_09740 [Reichenbachiella sp.]